MTSPSPRHALPIALLASLFATLIAALTLPTRAFADESHCVGAPECCPQNVTDELSSHQSVGLGVALIGMSNINERSGTWDADFYLYETWTPFPAFTPRTEIVNEVNRISEQFDTAYVRDGHCIRSRRIRSTLHTPYNLRTFPFDEQQLTIQFSDEEFTADVLTYTNHPYISGIDQPAREELSGWKLEGTLNYHRAARRFEWEPGAPEYDYATFSIPIARHITFHLTRFFLPLFVIVVIAFAMFWVDPDDLSSQVGIGVTCLLAAIAFQFAQSSNLPEVAYLTLADRVYVICYVALAAALVISVVSNSLARDGKKDKAMRLDRFCRWSFPLMLIVAIGLAVVRAATLHGV